MKQLSIILYLFCSILTLAQEPADTTGPQTSFGGEGNLSFSSTGFGDYYSGGGLGSTTVGALVNVYNNKIYANESIWDNSLRLDYGIARVENTNDEKFLKSSDVIDLISKFGTPVKNSDKWYYSAAFNLLTQINDTRTAYDAETNEFSQLLGVNGQEFGTVQSTLFAPADISLGIGLDYKPNDNFSAFFGPLSGKVRMVSNDDIAASGLYGNDVTYDPITGLVTDFDNSRFEAGASVIANYNNQFLTEDMLSFSTGLKLFSNYLEDPQNVDLNWNTITSLNPWKFITINYTTDLAYDDNKQFTAFANGEQIETGPKQGIQFRNVLGIGLVHKFGDSKE